MKEDVQKQRNQDRAMNEETSKQPLKVIVRDVRHPIIGYDDLVEYKPSPSGTDPYLYECKLCRVINQKFRNQRFSFLAFNFLIFLLPTLE